MEFGFSDYFIIGEFISCWGSLLICINTMLSYALYDKRQRMFLYAAGATLLASLFNIFSVRCIADFSPETIGICVFSTTLYFLVLLICPFVMSAYVCDMAFNHPKKKFIFYSVGGVVQIIYKLGNVEIRAPIIKEVQLAIDDWLRHNPDVAGSLEDKIIKNQKARNEINSVTEKQIREAEKSVMLKIKKLKDCRYHLQDGEKGADSMIFITEGDSAGAQGR